MKLSRRHMLGLGGAAVTGLVVNGLVSSTDARAGIEPEEKPFSWTPRTLDVKEVAPLAHERFYFQGYGCGYGVFYSTIGLMGRKFGDPYKSFPFSMLEMGKSGVSNQGTLCGALIGAVAAMALFWGRKNRDAMVAELFRWYELSAFPMYLPGEGLKVGLAGPLATSVSDSVICHISVSRWCKTSGFAAESKERSERCARLTADVAVKTTEIMNAKIGGSFALAAGPSDAQKHCTQEECHGADASKFDSPVLKSKMDCVPCHSGSEAVKNKLENHP